MPSQPSPNSHETQARARKAYRLARVLWEHDCRHPESVDRLGGHYRRIAEDVAKVNPASRETWAAVKGIIEAMVEEDASGRPVGASPSAMTRDEVVA